MDVDIEESPMRNPEKYLSYKAAWERIDSALGDGYWLEAITLCESIMADRLLSYVKGVDPEARLYLRTSFGKLIERWRASAGDSLLQAKGDLGGQVDGWREQRNEAVHGFVKSEPGTPTPPVDEFLILVKETAEKGRELARRVSDWHMAELRRAKATKKKAALNP
ncbi:MAG: hypothetical protein ABIJ00_16070 [Candidatus Eisenbacteria bacterium]